MRPVLRHPYGFLLESRGPTKPHAQWHFAGISPFAVLTGDLDSAALRIPSTGRVVSNGRAFSCLEGVLSDVRVDRESPDVPFCGGGVGFIGYDAGRAFEDLPERARRDFRMPHLHWAFYHQILAYHRERDRFWIVDAPVPDAYQSKQTDDRPVESLLDEARNESVDDVNGGLSLTGPSSVNAGRKAFERMVRRAKSSIRAGEIYQVNLSRRVLVEDVKEPGPVYRNLRESNPAPHGGFIRSPAFAVLSSSPELFLRVRGDQIQTRPIKGTRARAGEPAVDRERKRDLRTSDKDLAELHMIVDLERNDLGRICEYGTVETEELHRLETFSNVHHLVGTVVGTLRDDVGVRDILRATFPGGSVTGAPKIRAMKIIDELEPTRRQVYTGAMGWIGMNGDLELNVCIRTMEWRDETLCYQVGGGIVADSDPAKEYRETEDKAKGMIDALSSDSR